MDRKAAERALAGDQEVLKCRRRLSSMGFSPVEIDDAFLLIGLTGMQKARGARWVAARLTMLRDNFLAADAAAAPDDDKPKKLNS